MINEKQRIAKLVFTPESIESSTHWSLSHEDNIKLCYSCKSPLFYIHLVWGIVEEVGLFDMKILGDNHKYHYALREIGLVTYCAECGSFDNDYFKYFFPEDKVICSLEDSNFKYIEMEEIRHCLTQWNKKGDFTPNYNSPELQYLKKKFKDYEDKLKKPKKKVNNKKRGNRFNLKI